MLADEIVIAYERQFGPFVHMAPLDKAIWVRYLEQGGYVFAPFTYDIRVGEGVRMPPTASAFDKRAAYALTTKRIDALCVVDGTTRIIEVKQRAGLGSIGQMLGYKELYDRENPNVGTSEMWLVTDILQPDMRELLSTNKINVVEVGI